MAFMLQDHLGQTADKFIGDGDGGDAGKARNAQIFGQMAVFDFDFNQSFDMLADKGVRIDQNRNIVLGGLPQGFFGAGAKSTSKGPNDGFDSRSTSRDLRCRWLRAMTRADSWHCHLIGIALIDEFFQAGRGPRIKRAGACR